MNHDIDRTQIGLAPGGGSYAPRSNGPVLNEEQHAQMASALMDVNSEEELEYFLGDIISGVANTVGKFISSPTGQALGQGLKAVAKQVLPIAGQALGDYVGGGAGGQIGGALGTAAAGALEMEAEEMEWEAANTMVKIATDAVKKAAEAPQTANPQAIAKKAIIEAAKIHAPHIVGALTGEGHEGGCGCHHPHHHGRHHAGRWYRHGERIVLVGV